MDLMLQLEVMDSEAETLTILAAIKEAVMITMPSQLVLLIQAHMFMNIQDHHLVAIQALEPQVQAIVAGKCLPAHMELILIKELTVIQWELHQAVTRYTGMEAAMLVILIK